MIRRGVQGAAVFGLLTLCAACASEGSLRSDAATSAALDVPLFFERAHADVPSGSCANPMVDPRDGTKLRLVRSAAGRGDYEPPPGRYGVREGQLLRLDCGSGRTIGIVAR